MSEEKPVLKYTPAEVDNLIAEVTKWRNRATCWEKAARNAQSRYERLKASIEGLWDRYAQLQSEETIAAQQVEARDAQQQEGSATANAS